MAPLHEVFGVEIAAALGAPISSSAPRSNRFSVPSGARPRSNRFSVDKLKDCSALGAPTSESAPRSCRFSADKLHEWSPAGSTRASSPGSDSSTSDRVNMPSPDTKAQVGGSLAERRGLRSAILNDLGVEPERRELRAAILTDLGVEPERRELRSAILNDLGVEPARRGLRAAILNDLGVELDTPPCTTVGEVFSRQVTVETTSSTHCVTSLCPRSSSGVNAIVTTQRKPTLSPIQDIGLPCSSAMNSKPPTIFLGSSPGSLCDASQRSSAGGATLHASAWGNVASCTEATKIAARGSRAGVLASTQDLLSTSPSHAYTFADSRTGLDSVTRNSCNDAAFPWTPLHDMQAALQLVEAFPSVSCPSATVAKAIDLTKFGLVAISNEDLAEQLRAAAPEFYED